MLPTTAHLCVLTKAFIYFGFSIIVFYRFRSCLKGGNLGPVSVSVAKALKGAVIVERGSGK